MREFDRLRAMIRAGHSDAALLAELARAEAEHMKKNNDKEPVAPAPAKIEEPKVEAHGEAHSEGA